MRELTGKDPIGFTLSKGKGGANFLLPAIALMAGAMIVLFLMTVGFDSSTFSMERPYLIPWVMGTGIVIAAPMFYLRSKKELTFTNPIVFAALSYFFPVFFLGGWSLAFGLSHYFYLSYVSEPEYTFPLAFVYIMLGFAGLSIGFLLPIGKKVGNYAATWLPKWDFSPEELIVACIFFLIVGFGMNILALEVGQIGYQMGDVVFGDTGSLTFFLTIILPASTFLMWVAFFQLEKWSFLHAIVIAAQIATAIFMLVIMGGKSSLLMSAVLAIGAFVLVKRKVLLKHWVYFFSALVVTLLLGTIYGTNFREAKGSTDRVSVEQYGSIAMESLTSLGSGSLGDQLSESFLQLANRLETVSALAVVVSNHEALATYEAAYGLENNIWTYTWTALIPRFIWKDKPIIADGFSYNELYFDHGGFGLSLTAMGDLLRNYGPIGIPIGMLLLGFGIRVFYASLVEGLPFSAWRATIYFVVLTRISYDGFFGEILPTVIRISAVIFVQFLIMRIVVTFLRQMRQT
jgi:hypothetical protein